MNFLTLELGVAFIFYNLPNRMSGRPRTSLKSQVYTLRTSRKESDSEIKTSTIFTENADFSKKFCTLAIYVTIYNILFVFHSIPILKEVVSAGI